MAVAFAVALAEAFEVWTGSLRGVVDMGLPTTHAICV
jgi:hypothetical protein